MTIFLLKLGLWNLGVLALYLLISSFGKHENSSTVGFVIFAFYLFYVAPITIASLFGHFLLNHAIDPEVKRYLLYHLYFWIFFCIGAYVLTWLVSIIPGTDKWFGGSG